MAARLSTSLRMRGAIGLGLLAVWWPQGASAQTPQAPPPARTMAPGITASFAVGLGVQYCCPDEPVAGMAGSIQVPLGPRWSVEGRFQLPTTTRSTYDFGGYPNPYYVLSGSRVITDREFSSGGSVLYRFISGRRVSAFVGGGLTFWHATSSIENTKVCVPIVPGSCVQLDKEPASYKQTHNSWSPLVDAGLDVSLTKLITLFGGFRIDDGVTPYGGVRVSITTRPSDPLTAPTVRVRSTAGIDYEGRLVSITTSEVIIKQSGRSFVLPIDGVQRVEKTTHRVRNGLIIGALLGYVGGYFGSCGTGDEEDCWPEVGLLFAGIGTGAGALLGWSFNHRAASDGRDVLYDRAKRAPASLHIVPVVSLRRAGIGMLLRW